MNKRQKKRMTEWWSNLRIDEKEDYIKTVLHKNNPLYSPKEHEIEKMYNWAKG